MRPIALSLLLIGLATQPLMLNAAGFGDIRVLSGLGQPLHAEIPIIGADQNANLACYRLTPSNTSGLPNLTDAAIKLVRQNGQHLLLISGRRPVNEPAFTLAIRAGCGSEFQREYVILPELPVMRPATATPAQPEPRLAPRQARRNLVAAIDGESLGDIARRLRPNWPQGQRRLLAFLEQANPDWAEDASIPGGTEIVLPRRMRRTDLAAPAAAGKPLQTAPAATASRGDRLVVKPAPANVQVNASRQASTVDEANRLTQELNQRIDKMEATVVALQKEVDAIDKAINLAIEAEALRRQIQQAESKPEPTVAVVSAAPPAPAQVTTSSESMGWSEFLLAGLAGGAVATMALLAKAVMPRRRLVRPLTVAPSLPPAAIPADSLFEGNDVEEIDINDISVHEEAGIELAEIMLAFGRLKGAAVTLAEYIQSTTPEAPQAWLMLLDLYRRAGMEAEYKALAPKVGERFNLALPGWNAGWKGSTLKSLEDYPHITTQLSRNWGHAEAIDYLYSLVNDRRNGTRHGFPLEVMEEIVLLIRILEEGYGLHKKAA